MNRNEAKKLAETVTKEELLQMFLNAQESIKDWTVVSALNKGLSKGVAFNILSATIQADKEPYGPAKINMIWEFGEYLPNYKKEVKEKKVEIKPAHQEPKFLK